jgi:hypothetical protein
MLDGAKRGKRDPRHRRFVEPAAALEGRVKSIAKFAPKGDGIPRFGCDLWLRASLVDTFPVRRERPE